MLVFLTPPPPLRSLTCLHVCSTSPGHLGSGFSSGWGEDQSFPPLLPDHTSTFALIPLSQHLPLPP